MTSSSTARQRRTAVVTAALALLAAVCALLFAHAKPSGPAPGYSTGPAAAAASAAASPVASAPVSDPAADQVPAAHQAPAAHQEPGADQGPAAHQDAAAGAVWDEGPESPGCHQSKDKDSPLPASRGGTPEPQLLVFAPCPAPASQGALGDAHAAPPLRGSTPITPPSPVSLSVLRV